MLLKTTIPYAQGPLLNQIRTNGQIIHESFENEGTYIEAYVDQRLYGEWKKVMEQV